MVGDIQVARCLARLISGSNNTNISLTGKDWLSATEVDHWVTFASNRLQKDKDWNSSLKSINSTLRQVTYLVGNTVTLADIAVWGALRSKPFDFIAYFTDMFICLVKKVALLMKDRKAGSIGHLYLIFILTQIQICRETRNGSSFLSEIFKTVLPLICGAKIGTLFKIPLILVQLLFLVLIINKILK